jgi:integrase
MTNKKRPTPLRDGALDSDFSWLSSVFNWATKHKIANGRRLLDRNPLHDCTWPKEKNVRRPIASHERFLMTIGRANEIDSSGRLRLILALARYTGRRESAIIHLKASDVLLSQDRIRAALATAGMDERIAQHMPHGAIRWSADTDKQGLLHITPVSEATRSEIESYIAKNPRVGEVPLFPGPRDASVAISRVIASRWLLRAEKLAEVPKLTGGTFHPYRRLWASERRHLADVDVARAGGWKSTKTLSIYQQSDPAAVFAVVVNGN